MKFGTDVHFLVSKVADSNFEGNFLISFLWVPLKECQGRIIEIRVCTRFIGFRATEFDSEVGFHA